MPSISFDVIIWSSLGPLFHVTVLSSQSSAPCVLHTENVAPPEGESRFTYSCSLTSCTVLPLRLVTSNLNTPTIARFGCLAYASTLPQFPVRSGLACCSDASCNAPKAVVADAAGSLSAGSGAGSLGGVGVAGVDVGADTGHAKGGAAAGSDGTATVEYCTTNCGFLDASLME